MEPNIIRTTVSAGVMLSFLSTSYDKETFAAKTDLLLTHFIDMAVQGYGWVAA